MRKIIPTNIRETYHELGDFSIRFLLSDKSLINAKELNVDVKDSKGNNYDYTTLRWGKKFHVKFKIDNDISDGISSITFDVLMKSGKKYREVFTFWIIKP